MGAAFNRTYSGILRQLLADRQESEKSFWQVKSQQQYKNKTKGAW
jgi:hypothetical protein